jgi:ATP-dependent RNA helicase RhlE
MSFSTLGLSDQLVQGVLAAGYTTPTPIQSRAIPLAVNGRDVIGCAQTGTGKTAAFVLPMLHHLAGRNGHHASRRVRGLVLTPTRELALQVEESVATYGRFTGLQSLSVFGGVNMENQIKRLRRGVDIVVATPGRLLDHLQRRTIDLSHVEILVLDEADRMFDMGFINDVRSILSRLPAKRQTMLFSATMPKEVRALAASSQTNPELVEVGEQRRPVETVTQHFYGVPQEAKADLLFHILRTEPMESVLVFTRTKHGADKISRRLERGGEKAIAIHSNRTQSQRQHALDGFKRGHYKVLVATDIASRGIDVDGISHVINYDTPVFAEDYIHRIGRTGRAAATGDAITFVSRPEREYLRKIEYFVGKEHPVKAYPGFEASEQEIAAAKFAATHSTRGAASQRRTAGRKFRHTVRRTRGLGSLRSEPAATTAVRESDGETSAAHSEPPQHQPQGKFKRFFKRSR